jgi:DNA-binding LacI/PurR family transcriptional regulator
MAKKYTIRDIARISGYSLKTVSRVINNEPNVKQSTKEKIQKIVAETNFKPNLYAKNLNRKTLQNVLVSIRKTEGEMTTQWFDILMSYIIQEARIMDYNIVQEIIFNDLDLNQSILNQSSGYIDAVILFYLQDNDKRIDLAKENGIPVISFEKSKQVPISVCNNNRKGIWDAAEFLVQRNLTKVCLLLGAKLGVNVERELAMVQFYQTRGISMDCLEVVYDMNNLEKIRQFVKNKIMQHELPQVFFVSGDEKAIAVYHSIYAHGLTIPRDVSVIGFDNIPISQYYYPSLTTVAQDFVKLAKEMFVIIDKLVHNRGDVASVEVDPWLIIRDSVI